MDSAAVATPAIVGALVREDSTVEFLVIGAPGKRVPHAIRWIDTREQCFHAPDGAQKGAYTRSGAERQRATE